MVEGGFSMEMEISRKIMDPMDGLFVKLFDEVAMQVLPAFCHEEGVEPYLAFTVKHTHYHRDGSGYFDVGSAKSIIYTTKQGIFPSKSVDYINWSIGGPETHTVITPVPSSYDYSSNKNTDRAQRIACTVDKYFTLFIECANACEVRKLKDGRVERKNPEEDFSDFELLLMDRTKLALVTRLMMPGDFTLAAPTLGGLYLYSYNNLFEIVDRIDSKQEESEKKIKEAFTKLVENL